MIAALHYFLGPAGRWIIHVSGAGNEAGPWYGFNSGIGGAQYFPNPYLIGGGIVAVKHINCHQKGCWRFGHKIDGLPYRSCHKHHPDPAHRRLSRNVSPEHLKAIWEAHHAL